MKRVVMLVATAVAAVALPALSTAEAATLVSTSPAWQGSDGTTDIVIKVSVDADAQSTCQLLKAGQVRKTWEPCKASYRFPAKDLSDGNYELVARAQLGNVRQASRAAFTVDRTPPKVRMLSQSPRTVLYSFWAGWAVLEKEPRPPTFDVQSRLEGPLAKLGRWKRVAIGDQKAVQVPLRGGQTVCVRARATDVFGRTGRWSPSLCRTRYLDDRQLDGWRGSPKWQPVGNPGNTYGTGLVTKWHGVSVSTRVVHLSKLRIWGREGSYGGAVEIRIGNDVLKRVSLHRRDSKLVAIFSDHFKRPKSGRLTIEVISPNGRFVHLDALELRR